MAILWFLSCLVLLSGAYGQVTVRDFPGKLLTCFLYYKDNVDNIAKLVHDMHNAEYNLSEPFVPQMLQTKIRGVFKHLKSISSDSMNDITLTKMSDPPTLTQNESLVCLARGSDVFNNRDNCITTKLRPIGDYNDTSTNTQQMTVPILTNDECKRHWGIGNQEHKICTGLSSCMVDSGAPLLCERNRIKILAGFMSSSCSASTPATFTHISEFRDVIEKAIEDN